MGVKSTVKIDRTDAENRYSDLIVQCGNPKLSDGSHDDRKGVEQAAYLLNRLGLDKKRRFACAEVILTPVTAAAHGANEETLTTLNTIGLKP